MNWEAEVESLLVLARGLREQGDAAGAVQTLQHALLIAPRRAELHFELGNLWQGLHDHEQALTEYEKAVAADPEFVPALQNLGYLAFHQGDPERALECFTRALTLNRSPITQMLAATVLPVIYDSAEDLERWRARLKSKVTELVNAGLRIETSRSQIPTNFFLAYQGRNDREIAAQLGRIYAGVDALSACGQRREKPDRLRVGFLSAYFHDHTIGRLNLGRVQKMSRMRFEIVVLYAGQAQDAMANAFAQAADRYVPLPRSVERARQMIADQALDVLIFADVGMDAITSTLVYSRMAPFQCATYGHPVTTGSPTIDCFLSSELAETADADQHYTERLVRLPLLSIYYDRPVRSGPPQNAAYFGLDVDRNLYVCPQTLFKLHPEFDSVLAGILNADSRGVLVLLEGRVRNWTDRLKRRLARTIPDVESRVRFLPALAYDDYLALLELANVVIDPLHFSGGNSSYEALAMGTPIVTLPSEFLRGRITRALYAKMGMLDEPESPVVRSIPEFISTAVKLGTDPAARAQLSDRIRQRSHGLFNDLREVTVLEDFLWSAAF